MIIPIKLLVLLLALFSIIQAIVVGDECLDSSYVNEVVDKAFQEDFFLPNNPTLAEVNAILNTLYKVFVENTNPNKWLLFVSTDATWYTIRSCLVGTESLDAGCGPSGTRYIIVILNNILTNDFSGNLHFWQVPNDLNTTLDLSALRYIGPSIPFVPVNRAWWGVDGWSPVYTFGIAGGSVSQSLRTLTKIKNGVHIGAHRSTKEPCNFYLESLEAIPLAKYFSTHIDPSWLNIIDDFHLKTIIRSLHQTLLIRARTDQVFNLFVAFSASKDYYQVHRCEYANKFANPLCNGSIQWIARIKNFKLFGDEFNHYFELTPSGDFGKPLRVDPIPYDPTTSVWYQQINSGWTELYNFSSVDIVSRSYIAWFHGGVVGSDPVIRSEGFPCRQRRV